MSFASGSGEGNQGQQGQNEDYMAIGNTKNPKTLFSWSAMVWDLHTITYRYYADNPNTKELDQTAFDKYLKGTNRTNPNDPKENVTDSRWYPLQLVTKHIMVQFQ